jgi:Glu-tRNA(Gln) amidotransferase subunit E-like FAD-binding protein
VVALFVCGGDPVRTNHVEFLHVRLTIAEREALVKLAQERNLTVSKMLRQMLAREIKAPDRPPREHRRSTDDGSAICRGTKP